MTATQAHYRMKELIHKVATDEQARIAQRALEQAARDFKAACERHGATPLYAEDMVYRLVRAACRYPVGE